MTTPDNQPDREADMKFYRYTTVEYAYYDSMSDEYRSRPFPDPHLQCTEYDLIRETPKGYWVGLKGLESLDRWVSKTARKRFAYPTKAEALNSFIIRKERQIAILTRQLQAAEVALEKAKVEQQTGEPRHGSVTV